ncbi:MAG: T9SS type A sorting domain-containing protein [Bacteroidota bacterium]
MKSYYILLFAFLSCITHAQSSFMKESPDRPIANRGVVTPIVASISYQGYEETQPYFGEGEYEIFLDNVDGVLDKPIIVLDGFDPGDGRDIAGLYNSLTFDGDNLADIVRDEGFDIVILNAPQYTTDGKDIDGGADYIQRNAFVLIEMINFLNAEKVGDEELVVLGPSMGGLIARYGLSYMEQNAMDPETRLYISFDSPHRGANIPMSLQYLINYLAESSGDPDAQAIVQNVLNSPAAKEMLIDHLLAHLLAGSTFEQDPTKLLPEGAPNFRDAFQTELDNLGFPQTVRNVAMVNGSALGTTIGMPGMQLIDTTLDLGGGITADVNLHFMPEAGQTNNITTFNTFLVGIPVATFGADAQSFATSDGVDSAPGGTSNIADALGGAGSGNPVIDDFIAALDQEEYCFIPVLSSLAIDEDDWYTLPNPADSPFVNTYIPDVNEPHVAVTAESAQFALNEIRQILGIGEVSNRNSYLLVENPVSEKIRILLNTSNPSNSLEVTAYNMAGQELFSQKLVASQREISIAHSLPSGFYILKLKDVDSSYQLKFLVE